MWRSRYWSILIAWSTEMLMSSSCWMWLTANASSIAVIVSSSRYWLKQLLVSPGWPLVISRRRMSANLRFVLLLGSPLDGNEVSPLSRRAMISWYSFWLRASIASR